MSTKVKELDNRKEGDRNACVICNPRKDRISMSQLWEWQRTHPGEPVFIDPVTADDVIVVQDDYDNPYHWDLAEYGHVVPRELWERYQVVLAELDAIMDKMGEGPHIDTRPPRTHTYPGLYPSFTSWRNKLPRVP